MQALPNLTYSPLQEVGGGSEHAECVINIPSRTILQIALYVYKYARPRVLPHRCALPLRHTSINRIQEQKAQAPKS